jgi:uncharacterized protein (DUF302 family)
MRAHHLRAGGFVADELIDLGNRSIEYGHAIPVVVHVQDQVLAHDGQADQPDVTIFFFHRSLLKARIIDKKLYPAILFPFSVQLVSSSEKGKRVA